VYHNEKKCGSSTNCPRIFKHLQIVHQCVQIREPNPFGLALLWLPEIKRIMAIHKLTLVVLCFFVSNMVANNIVASDEVASVVAEEMPLIHKEDFEDGLKFWRMTNDDVWKIVETKREGEISKSLRVTGKSKYQPPVRSPHSIAWLKEKFVGDFVLTVQAENTNYKAGGHRDLCLFWGRQDASHFYYVHFGATADAHSCQIFIVDGKPRTKITVDEVDGTPWGEGVEWHTLRVERTVGDGTIKVFFGDMKKPHMTAKDTTFAWGEVGIGTFDDNGNFDDFELRGISVEPQKRANTAPDTIKSD